MLVRRTQHTRARPRRIRRRMDIGDQTVHRDRRALDSRPASRGRLLLDGLQPTIRSDVDLRQGARHAGRELVQMHPPIRPLGVDLLKKHAPELQRQQSLLQMLRPRHPTTTPSHRLPRIITEHRQPQILRHQGHNLRVSTIRVKHPRRTLNRQPQCLQHRSDLRVLPAHLREHARRRREP